MAYAAEYELQSDGKPANQPKDLLMPKEIKRAMRTRLDFGNGSEGTMKYELWRQGGDTASLVITGPLIDFRNPTADAQVAFLMFNSIMRGEGSRIGSNTDRCSRFKNKR